MSRTRAALSIPVILALVLGALALGAVSSGAVEVTKVTICHRTNSDTNPYVEITPDVSGVLDGHAKKHNEPRVWGPTLKAQHLKWGDIIPPFDYAVGQHFDGLNMTATDGQGGTITGAEILENGCVIPGEEPPPPLLGSLEVTKTVLGTPAGTPTPTGFTVHVLCDDDSVDENVVFPATGGSQTFSGLIEGITCTVSEADTATFAPGTVVSFNGVPSADPSVGVDVEIVGESTVTVTVDNSFPEAGGEVVNQPPTAGAAVAPSAVTSSPRLTG